MKKGLIVLGVISLLFLMTIANASAITGKIGNGKMLISSDVGETISRTIRVINDNDVAVNITLFASGDLEEDITIIDKSFILQPNTEKNAQFKVEITKEGISKINVRFTPLTDAPGVGLSAQLTVKTNGEGGDATDESITGEVTVDSGEGDENDNPNKIRNTFLVIMGVLTIILIIILIVLLSSAKSKNQELYTSQVSSVDKIKSGVKK